GPTTAAGDFHCLPGVADVQPPGRSAGIHGRSTRFHHQRPAPAPDPALLSLEPAVGGVGRHPGNWQPAGCTVDSNTRPAPRKDASGLCCHPGGLATYALEAYALEREHLSEGGATRSGDILTAPEGGAMMQLL